MNRLEKRVLCEGCPKLNAEIKDSGTDFGVDYVTLKSKTQYVLIDNADVCLKRVMRAKENFSQYVPRFGKCEIENFIGYRMQEAIFDSKDITDLLNSELLCDDFPYNITKVSAERIREKLLKCFFEVTDVPGAKLNTVYLMFKWIPYPELK